MIPLKLSRKINIVVAVLILLIGISIGGYLVLKSKFGAASINQQLIQIIEQNKESITGCQPNPNDKNKDSDNDGLPDWQETIWQTDSCKADTDGDGYLDGEEVSAGYNPVKPAPNDKLPDTDQNRSRALPNNLTQALAQDLTQRMAQGEMGVISDALNPTSVNVSNQVIDKTIQEIVIKAKQEFSLPNISDEEIIISPNNNAEAVQSYAGKIVQAIEQWEDKSSIKYDESIESESQIFYEAIQTKDFSQIDKCIKFYQGAAEEFKKIATPSDLKNIHKEQIGIFWITANIFKAVKQIDQDPLKTNLALEQYKATSNLLKQMLLKLADYLENNF